MSVCGAFYRVIENETVRSTLEGENSIKSEVAIWDDIGQIFPLRLI